MHSIFSLERNIILKITLILAFTLVILISLSFINHSKLFSVALSLDFIITFPCIYYFLIRKYNISKLTIIPFITLGYFAAKLFINTKAHLIIDYYPIVILPIIELFVLTYIVITLIKYSRKVIKQKLDFYDSILNVLLESFPKFLSYLLSLEITSIYYVLFKWRRQQLEVNEFTYHKRSGILAVLFVFIFLIFIETVVLHLLLIEWNTIVAWLLTISSLYMALQLTAISKAVLYRPIIIEKDQIILRYSFLKKASIAIKDIKNIQLSRSKPGSKDLVTLSPFGELEAFNMVISFKSNQIITNAYGKENNCSSLCLSIDNPEDFINMVKSYQNPSP